MIAKTKKQGEKATTTNEKTRLICLLLYFKVSFLQKARRQKRAREELLTFKYTGIGSEANESRVLRVYRTILLKCRTWFAHAIVGR